MATAALAPVPPHVPANRVIDFDVYNPAGIEHGFHQAWMRLHGEGVPDLVWTPRNGGHWIATRGQLIRQFLNEPDNFSARVMIVPKEAGREHKLVPMNMDPPEHGPYRRVLNRGLGPREIRAIEGDIRAAAIELIEAFAQDGKVDFCAEYANIFPIKVFLAFSHLPLSDAPLLTRFSNSMLRPEGTTPEEKAASMANANAGFFAYIAPTVAARRANPSDDWISLIIHSEVNGKPVTEYETLAMISLVLLAGLDTVVNFLPFCMDYLARHPERVAELRTDPAKIPARIDELFRRFPVVSQARLVTRDVIYDGVTLKEGEMVLIPSTLHGTDLRENAEPLKVDFARKKISHSTFGGGAHICAGMHLANLEIIVTLQEWLKRIPEFRVAEGFRLVAHSGVVAQVERLDLEWESAP